jgi:hypothetical protein
VALSEAGHMYAWDMGGGGQLGHNDDEEQLVPQQVEVGHFGAPLPLPGNSGHSYTCTLSRLATPGVTCALERRIIPVML